MSNSKKRIVRNTRPKVARFPISEKNYQNLNILTFYFKKFAFMCEFILKSFPISDFHELKFIQDCVKSITVKFEYGL